MVALYVFMVYPNIKQHTLCRKNQNLFFTQKHELDHFGHILSPGPVWPQDLVDITGDVLLGQTAGEEAPGVAHEALAGLTRYIPTRLTHCLKQWDLLCGVPLIYLPSPRREKFFDGVQERGVWREVEGGEEWVISEPLPDHSSSMKTNIVPDNDIIDLRWPEHVAVRNQNIVKGVQECQKKCGVIWAE